METLLLHACCGPCSTHAIDYFCREFKVMLYYYNPCIMPAEEYQKRKQAIEKYANLHNIPYSSGEYDNDNWQSFIQGYEKDSNLRCLLCYQFRLLRTAQEAIANAIPCFSTTLTISPHKNSGAINQMGMQAEKLAGNGSIRFIAADLKKQNGFGKSVQLSREYDIYRQNYCGCQYSMR